MSSSSTNQNPPWPPYQTYRDCSQGICSIYCPQWCYIIFPPPPPPRRRFPSSAADSGGDDGSSATDFSPLIIAVIGILASAFILITYYTIITKYCRRRGGGGGNSLDDDPNNLEQHHNSGDPGWTASSGPSGLEESVIKSIAVLNYRRGDGLVEGSDCSVCLSEFQEEEKLRLLPKCRHAFHVPCIDAWLKSHATCPLCRANIHAAAAASAVVVVGFVPPPPPPATTEEEIRDSEGIESGDVISEIAVVAAEDLEAGGGGREGREESGGKVEIEWGQSQSGRGGGDQVGISISQMMRRSSSLNFAAAPLTSVSSGGIVGTMKRSVSTGRFLFMSGGDGNSSSSSSSSASRIPI